MIPYKHEPFTDFSIEKNRNAYLEGLKTVEAYLGQDYPLVIGGERITTEVLETLAAQARLLWGEADAERQRPALSQTAEEIAVVARTPVPADLEPKFFA